LTLQASCWRSFDFASSKLHACKGKAWSLMINPWRNTRGTCFGDAFPPFLFPFFYLFCFCLSCSQYAFTSLSSLFFFLCMF
jgi:hypothetical protein